MPNHARASEAYEFLSALIDSFEITNIARHQIEKVNFLSDDPTSTMSSIVVFKNELHSAKQIIDPYPSSKNIAISNFGKAYQLTYIELIQIQESLLKLYEILQNEPNDSKEGTLLKYLAIFRGRLDTLWRQFPEHAANLTNILVESSDGSSKLTHLTLTSQEKQSVMNDLIRNFGEGIKSSPQEEKDPLADSAALLYDFLNNMDFISSGLK